MPTKTKKPPPREEPPAWRVALDTYEPMLDPEPGPVADARYGEWMEVDSQEREYTIAQLLYAQLDLLAEIRLLLRPGLRQLAGRLDELVDAVAGEEEEEEEEEEIPADDHDDAGVADNGSPAPAPVTQILDAESRPRPAPETGRTTR